MNDETKMPLVVGIGGTNRISSSSEIAMRTALERIASQNLETISFCGENLDLPLYDPSRQVSDERSSLLINALRRADGVIIASPCYHGSVSGLIKNALDYIEETAGDERPYLDGKVIGLVGVGYGNQGPAMVLSQLRTIAHSLRGWPVPMGVAINAATTDLKDVSNIDAGITHQLNIMADQMVEFISRGFIGQKFPRSTGNAA